MKSPLAIIAENLDRDRNKLSRLYDRLPAYLDDLASHLVGRDSAEMGDEELSLSYQYMKEELNGLLSQENSGFSKAVLEASAPILAAELAKILCQKATVTSYLSAYDNTPARIAYFRNAYSDLAYRRFSKELFDPTVIYCDSFAAVCEELFADRCEFAILPVESSQDGKLTAVEKLVARYSLAPMLYYRVPTHDDGYIRFGLFSASPLLPPAQLSASAVEIILFSDEKASAAKLLTSADYLGCALEEMTPLAATQGFLCAWHMVFSAESEEALLSLRVLLGCEHPHHLLCGIYQELK